MRACSIAGLGAVASLLLATGGCADSSIEWDLSGKLLSIQLNSPFPLELRRIEPGSFTMGSTPEAGARYNVPDNEKPSHEVKLSEPFFIAVHETTNEHYRRFDPEHDSSTTVAALPEEIASEAAVTDFNDDRSPAVGVSYREAQQYCEWLSKQSGLSVRLPTEAEWEYACRADGDTAYSWGDSRAESSKFANLAEAATAQMLGGVEDPAAREDGKRLTSRVASFQANANGLYDMHGNVAEWCQDVYSENYNNSSPDGSANQVGMDSERHVVRGGSWASGMDEARSAARESLPADSEDAMTGFRIVIEMPETMEAGL